MSNTALRGTRTRQRTCSLIAVALWLTAALLAAACGPGTTEPAGRTSAPSSSSDRAAGDVGYDEASGAEGEGDESAEELAEARETTKARVNALRHAQKGAVVGQTEPILNRPARGWAGEDLWSRHSDDWEPAIAADPNSSRVYLLGTRFGGAKACATCPGVAIRLRVSRDGGRSWGKAGYLCRCADAGGQFDPQIEVSRDGTVYAAFLRGFTPGVTFMRSSDHGRTWTRPTSFTSSGSAWSDKPSLAVSPDGRDVYIAYNGPSRGDSWMAQSHDAGNSWTASKIRDSERYIFAGGGAASNGGVVAFGESDYNQHYTGKILTLAVVSTDGGATWSHVHVATGKKQPDCTSTGCYDGFYGPTPAIGRDGDGDLVIAFAANHVRGGRQRLYVARSTDDGRTWGSRNQLSPKGANAVFPALVGGGGGGDLRLWWMDTRTGQWNVWYRTSDDGGVSWSKDVRISDATSGTAYVSKRGFLEAYGDYGEIDITNRGRTVAAWGEGPSYVGPGGVWFNRTT